MKRLAVLMLFAVPCFAQSERPTPVIDKPFIAVSSTLAGTYIADELSTNALFNRCPNCIEGGWFGHYTRNMPQIAAETAAYDSLQLFAAYEWKKRIHNRLLNKAWVALPLAQVGLHIAGVVNNEGISGKRAPVSFSIRLR